MIAFTEIALGSGGLPSCSRCGPASDLVTRSLPDVSADLRDAVSGWPGGPGPNVALVGAEPFLHPELPSIVGQARQLGVRRLMLRTGGAVLGAGDNAGGSLDAGVRQLELVLLGGEPAVHDSLTGRPGAFEAARSGVLAFVDAAAALGRHVNVVGRVPVCEHNADAVASAVGALGALGASAVCVDLTDAHGLELGDAWFSAIADTGMVNRVWVWFSAPLPTCSSAGGLDPAHLIAPFSRTEVAR